MEAVGALVRLGIIVVAVVLAGLAIFMPLFVYQIRNHSEATLKEI